MVDLERSFSDVVRSEHRRLVQLAYLITGSRETAEDVAQDALVALHVHWAKVSAYDSIPAWLRRVLVRRAIRCRSTTPDLPYCPPIATELSVDTALHVRAALLRLPTRQRTAAVLYYLCDLSTKDIATAMDCRQATARVLLHQARDRLHDLLTEGQTVEISDR